MSISELDICTKGLQRLCSRGAGSLSQSFRLYLRLKVHIESS